MYNIKGPSKIVAKTTRRGIPQNLENYRDVSRNKSVDANDNELNGPLPTFHNNSKRVNTHHSRQQQEPVSPQHEEIIKFIHDSWMFATSTSEEEQSQTNPNRKQDKINANLYYKEQPCPQLKDFKPFDLESWWGKRLYNIITNSVNVNN